MIALSILLGLVAAVLLLPVGSDAVSLVRALARGGQRRRREWGGAPPRLLFLVPAHDEELLIGDCVRSLLRQDYPRSGLTVLVLADNCTDRTVERAHRAGAHTLERHDPERPGKPRAIAWALSRIALSEYDALVIVDADTEVDRGFAAALARVGGLRHRAGQAYFDVSNRGDSPLTRMGAVLATGNHRFAYRLKRAAGLNVPMVGNGMWLGCGVLAEYGWNAFSITEDWELYASLTARGVRIEGVPEARLYSQEARSLDQSATQRRRWTAGRLSVLRSHVLPILASARIDVHQKLDAIAELAVPGPALHLALGAALGAAALALRMPGTPVLLALLGAGLVRPAVYASAALLVDPEPGRAALAFAHLPGYALWRLGNAARALPMVGGNAPWVRTARHAPEPAERS